MTYFKHCFLLALLVLSFPLFAQPPENLTTAKQAVTQYCESGEYNRDIQKTIKPAKRYLQSRILSNKTHKKLALVFDIDETSVSHYQDIKKNDYGQTYRYVFHTVLPDTHGEPITPVRSLYNFGKDHHVAVFLVTGRKEKLRYNTVKLLHNCGYTHWTKLIMEPNDYKNPSAIPFKSAMRQKLIQQGYDIVLNVGDQKSDLKGGFADRKVLIPNPFYLVG
ncbi:MAG: HAD family acid phosphatase [Pseudomonadota bacterium]|nr:HAD family acid phosphatase [Gammaproteobacteria bacterium]MBU1628679.1 HAD family acid phosphatase [Gammaproteobacteria bacterium]MBU2545999.1 HAD family acid phosphatase [Gammaproteobacteria bacterium]